MLRECWGLRDEEVGAAQMYKMLYLQSSKVQDLVRASMFMQATNYSQICIISVLMVGADVARESILARRVRSRATLRGSSPRMALTG